MRTCVWCLVAGVWSGISLLGCGQGEESGCPQRAELTDQGLALNGACGRAELRLLPAVRVRGLWHGAGRDGGCALVRDSPAGVELGCPAGEAGQVRLGAEGQAWRVRLLAARETVVEALALEGPARIEGARGMLSNGFQSWSQSGALALGPLATDEELLSALAEQGDAETLRGGQELSWWLGHVGGGRAHLAAGALSAARLRSWVQAGLDPQGALFVRLGSGGVERVALAAGEQLEGERWHLGLGEEPTGLLADYGRALPARRRTVAAAPELGWNSWYELWGGVDAEAVRANAAAARLALAGYAGGAPLRVVVDDGWQVAWGQWEPNAKFPEGLSGLADELRGQGFSMGVWFAPLLVDEESRVFREHPDWLVGGATFQHGHGLTHVLDVTHPDAAAFLADSVRRLVGWGCTFLKIDFLFAGTYEGTRHEPMTGMAAFARALALIREAAGEEVLILAVGAPPVPVAPFVDAWRSGGDIAWQAAAPAWTMAVNQARSLAARWPFCEAVLCDPDPPILRAPLEPAEVGFGAWVVALAGGGLFLSDDLRALPAERYALGLDADRVGLALRGAAARPEDPLPEGLPTRLSTAVEDLMLQENSHALPTRWRLQDGRRLGLNLEDEARVLEGVSVPGRGAALLPSAPP
ncbi:MAG TPA: alpha-galactosidase [Myxococcota bacterium]|nr:alpha-galactosidase [Myxococcota bacterium]HRY93463.1 alpha-galactosidase [Myxococcota bacterium]HSA20310.1 alpha-galactosidase [Myxococcota bacterium]